METGTTIIEEKKIRPTRNRKRSSKRKMKRRTVRTTPYARPRTYGRPSGAACVQSLGAFGSATQCSIPSCGTPSVAAEAPVLQCMEPRKLLNGLTIVTHGFTTGDESNLDPWVKHMASEVVNRIQTETGFSNDQIPVGTITATKQDDVINIEKSNLNINLPQWKSGEIVLKLDWTSIASFFETTTTSLADAVVNKLLDPSFFKSRGYGDGIQLDHSDTHLWYHGTIDNVGDWDDGNIHMANRKRSVWFDDGEGGGTTTGYYYSRVGGGDRASTASPGKSNNMIRDGLHTALGGSRAEQKTIAWSSNTNWANLLQVGVDGGYTQQIGRKVSFNYKYSDWDSGTTVRIRLDNDLNPYNGFDQEVGSSVDATRTFDESNHVRNGVIKWNTSGQKASTAFVFAQITDDAGHTRYLYAPDQLQLTKANHNKGIDLSIALPNSFDGLIANNIYQINGSSSRSIFDINLNDRTSTQMAIIQDWFRVDSNTADDHRFGLNSWQMIDIGNHDRDSHRDQPMILTDHFITTSFDPIV